VLHNLVASHKDAKAKQTSADTDHASLSRSGFHCPCDNLVAESPFEESGTVQLAYPVLNFQELSYQLPDEKYTAFPAVFQLRGPPAC